MEILYKLRDGRIKESKKGTRNYLEQQYNKMTENIIQNNKNIECLNRKAGKHQIITTKNANGLETRNKKKSNK